MYKELKNQQPDHEECFWAFSKIQFEEGLEKKSLQKDQIINGGSGLYGTQNGLDKLYDFYTSRREEIKNKCNPQEIYEHEYWNHECEYTGSDQEAINIVKDYFGDESIKTLKRF
jgi:hypothetical protein